MMRRILSLLFLALTFMAFTQFGSASATLCADLQGLVSGNEDIHMNSMDLAFFLATHGYDATPRDGYVEVDLDGAVYKAVPNGSSPGLADIETVH